MLGERFNHIGPDKPEKIKLPLKVIRGKPRASARHGALQMPTFNSWLASQRKLGLCHV